MHYTQNDKIRQATEGTIVVGVDIGSEKNYARLSKATGSRSPGKHGSPTEDIHLIRFHQQKLPGRRSNHGGI